jgi:hypothetical protein
MWEAAPKTAAQIWGGVPADIMPKFQFYNVPASPDINHPASPVRVLKELAQPGDFVLFKLDIDNSPVEMEIVDSISKDPAIAGLIDEFIFEHHVNFEPMHRYWASAGIPATMQNSYELFTLMRSKFGIRAHSWT